MADILRFADKYGPAKIIQVFEPSVDLKALLVIDNVAMGPALGGIRMAPDVTIEECFRLARTMTFKHAAAGSAPRGRQGGGLCRPEDAQARQGTPDPGPGRLLAECAGLHHGAGHGDRRRVHGLDQRRGRQRAWPGCRRNWAVFPWTKSAPRPGGSDMPQKWPCRTAGFPAGFSLEKARVAVQGFGAVGKHAARFLAEQKAVLVGVSDTLGAVYDPHGLDVDELIRLKDAGKSVMDYPEGEKFDRDGIIDFDCDIWIPAARPDVVHEDNVHRLKARLVVEGANIPLTLGAEKYLHEQGVVVIPDFIANSGAVICSAIEYRGAIDCDSPRGY